MTGAKLEAFFSRLVVSDSASKDHTWLDRRIKESLDSGIESIPKEQFFQRLRDMACGKIE